MKAVDFDYERAASLDAVCALLARRGAKRKIIAGGQTLVPLMAMRLARPGAAARHQPHRRAAGHRARGRRASRSAPCTRQADALRRRRRAPRRCRSWRRRWASSATCRRATAARSAAASPMPIRRPRSGWRRWRSTAEVRARSAGRRARDRARRFFPRPDEDGARARGMPDRSPLSGLARRRQDRHRLPGNQHPAQRFRARCRRGAGALDAGGVCRRAARCALGGADVDAGAHRRWPKRGSSAHASKSATSRRRPQLAPQSLAPSSDLHASADYRRRVVGALVQRALAEAQRGEARA